MDIAETEDIENISGAVIFVLYIIAALGLVAWIVLTLYRTSSPLSSSPDPKAHQRIYSFSVLALVSFATLSYHMLSFLITSYCDWVVVRGIALPRSLSYNELMRLQLWQWAKTSTLFQNFAKKICTQWNGNWCWTEHVLIFSMAWNIYMAVEGNARQVASVQTVMTYAEQDC
jgi:hypothetical protein